MRNILLLFYVTCAFGFNLNRRIDFEIISRFRPGSVPAYTVIGGVEVTPHSLPFQAAIIIDDTYFCGGSIISSKYVLTAAHCTWDCEYAVVILGAHKWRNYESTQWSFLSTIIINHEKFSGEKIQENDIALIKSPVYIPFSKAIQPISLPDANSNNFRYTAAMSGWGFTSTGSGLSLALRKVYLITEDNSWCHLYFTNVSDSQICTKGYDSITGVVGACYGDSGGPLVNNNVLIGLVSYGYDICEMGYPTVYTNVTYHREWIKKHSGV